MRSTFRKLHEEDDDGDGDADADVSGLLAVPETSLSIEQEQVVVGKRMIRRRRDCVCGGYATPKATHTETNATG